MTRHAPRKLGIATVLGATVVLVASFGPARSALAQAPTSDSVARTLSEQVLPRTAIPYNPNDFDKYVGYYQDKGPVFTIRRDGEHLLTRLTGQVDVEVYPESPTKFFAKLVPAQISFETNTQGAAVLVLHQGGLEQHFRKISEGDAIAYEAAITARAKAGTPDPAREILLRRYIETRTQQNLDLSFMAPRLVRAAQQQQPAVAQIFAKIGAFKSLTFKGVANQGVDVDIYVASFENGDLEFRVSPLEDGKLGGLRFRELP